MGVPFRSALPAGHLQSGHNDRLRNRRQGCAPSHDVRAGVLCVVRADESIRVLRRLSLRTSSLATDNVTGVWVRPACMIPRGCVNLLSRREPVLLLPAVGACQASGTNCETDDEQTHEWHASGNEVIIDIITPRPPTTERAAHIDVTLIAWRHARSAHLLVIVSGKGDTPVCAIVRAGNDR